MPPKHLWRNNSVNLSNMLILVFTVSILWIHIVGWHYPIHTMIQKSKYIIAKPLNWRLIVQTKIFLLIKLVIRLTAQHYIRDIQFFCGIKSSIGRNLSIDYLKAPSNPQNGAKNYVISGITTPLSFINIYPNNSSVKDLLNINFQHLCLIVQFYFKEHN